MKNTTLDLIRRATPKERKEHEADFVFIRNEINSDRSYKIWVSKPSRDYAWCQWGQNGDILDENVDAIEKFFAR